MILTLHCRACRAHESVEAESLAALPAAIAAAGWGNLATCPDCLADPRPALPGQSVVANVRAALGLKP